MRLLGACLCLAGAWGLVQILSKREKRRVALYGAILHFLQYISDEVSCFHTPRGELFLQYFHPALEEVGFLTPLKEQASIASALTESHLPFTDEACKLLQDFDEALGKSYVEETVRLCGYYISRWQVWEESVRTTLKERLRLTRTVVLSLALLLVLLLL